MTAYYGTNATRRRATPPQLVDNGDQGGRVRHSYDEIATTTAMTTADTLEAGLLPVEARVVGIEVAWIAHGASRTFKVGDAGDDDRYFASASSENAGSSNALAAAGVGYRNTSGAPVPILITLAGGTLAAGAKGYVVSLKYVQD
jgi:ABC-type tungstate transport system permease subunit